MADRARWRRTALALAWATIAWNSLEAVIAIASGAEAGSIALVGFGLNSIVEVGSALVVVWQLSGADVEREQRALKRASPGSSSCSPPTSLAKPFGTYAARSQPDESVPGIVLAALSLLVMPVLTGRETPGGTSDVEPDGGCRQRPDDAVQLPVRHPARWPGRRTPPWAGGGPTPSQRSSLPPSRSAKDREAWRGEVCCDAC